MPPLIARQLFWRIYATVIVSLGLSVALVAMLWIGFGATPPEVWNRLPNRLLEAALPPTADPAALQAEAARLADALDGDLTVLSPNGRVLAAAGVDLSHGHRRAAHPWAGRRGNDEAFVFLLADGRVVLARFGFELRRPYWHVAVALLLVALVVGIAALPVVARITHRLERMRRGMDRWGAGDLATRVPVQGDDEIAAVARSFNAAAERIETLLAAHRALLANASHELRSPLARLSVATSLWSTAQSDPALVAGREAEIARNLAELDQLIDEILLASRLDHLDQGETLRREPVDLLALAAEEAARTGATVDGEMVETQGDAKLLRRLLRNLLENAVRHGAPPVEVEIGRDAAGRPRIEVRDQGPGIPEAERERIFTPFYRPQGSPEGGGGWGLGLALVRKIALRHGGQAICAPRSGGGTVFVITLG